nr:LysR family transcriptional regulator [Oceanospirillum sediminis]
MAEIRAFNAVVEQGNFSRAAQSLGVSQPAITAQMQKLEGRFDTQIMERNHGGIKLTDLGKRLYKITQQYQDLETLIHQLANDDLTARNRDIQVATSSPLLFLPLTVEFRKLYPDANVKVVNGTTEECKAMLLAREVDIGMFPVEDGNPELSKLSFHTHKLVAIVPVEHSIAKLDAVSVDELIRHPLIFTTKGAITQDFVDQAFASKGHFPEPNICLDGRFETCHAVHLGLGIGFAFVEDVPKDEGLAQVPIKEKPNETTEHICWLRSRSNVQGIRDFVDMALEKCSEKYTQEKFNSKNHI